MEPWRGRTEGIAGEAPMRLTEGPRGEEGTKEPRMEACGLR